MNKNTNNKQYDLEDRTLDFGKNTIKLCKTLPKNIINLELIKQLMRSSCSIGANYREANDAISKKDFLHRTRIARKEARETTYQLNLILESNPEFNNQIEILTKECQELRNILSAILTKSEKQV